MKKYFIKNNKETINQLENKYKGQFDLKKLIEDALNKYDVKKNTQIISVKIEVSEF